MPGPADPGPGVPIDPLTARIYAGVLSGVAIAAFVVAVALIVTGG